VATPGRLLALAKDKTLDLSKVKHFVLDECDQMLEQLDSRGMHDGELGDEERLRAPEASTTTWRPMAVVQQLVLVGLLASAYLSWGRLEALHERVQDLELHRLHRLHRLQRLAAQHTRLNAHDTRLDALELGRTKHDAWLEALLFDGPHAGWAGQRDEEPEDGRERERADASDVLQGE